MFTPYWTLALAIQVAYGCIPLTPPPPNSTPAPTEAASEEPEASEAPTTTTTANPTTTTAKPTEETTKKPENKDCVTVELNPGRPCAFPFTYQYHQHYECLPFKSKFWCALTSLYDKDQWGYCDESLCPPTAAVLTEEPGSTTTIAPATNTTTTTAAEAWDDGTTTIAIKTMETYACQVDFQYSLQQGVKIRDVSSVCSGSSSQSNDAVIDKLGNHKFSLKTAEGIELECEVGAALLEDSKSLSEEVLTSSLKCEAVEAGCITVEGEVYPAQCVIPFNYNNRRYLGCTDRPGSTKLWCPTKTDETGKAEDKFWGYCSRQCRYCGGSPITTRADQEESCGYDCLLGADWDMAPLLKPTIEVSLPAQSNYLGEKGDGQHALNIGPQFVTISCPETKFFDPALQQETKLNVQCGPQKDRMTVTSESGTAFGENLENDQFGCDPCPLGMSYVEGYIPDITDVVHLRYLANIETIGKCHQECLKYPNCKSFQYSEKACQLIQDVVKESTLSSKKEGYTVCAQEEAPKLCGTNPKLDPNNPIAEKNWPFISEALNQASHPNEAYRTHVFEVVTEKAEVVMTSTDCPNSDPGLVSLFIAPSSLQCNAATLGASSTLGLHHVMVLTSCQLYAPIQQFISDKDKFKQYFNGVPMKLCGARTWMKSVVAESRKTTLMDVFSFLYNTEATADSFDLDDTSDCKSKEETVKTMKIIFDNSDKVGFLSETNLGTEEDGFIKIPLKREPTTAMGITFVTTTFIGGKNADINDIVPYNGIITFPPNSESASLFITIIQDNISEADEFVHLELDSGKKRNPWALFKKHILRIKEQPEPEPESEPEPEPEPEPEIFHECSDTPNIPCKKQYEKCFKDINGNKCKGYCTENDHCIRKFNADNKKSCQQICLGIGPNVQYTFLQATKKCKCDGHDPSRPTCDKSSAKCKNCENDPDCSHQETEKVCFKKGSCVECSSEAKKGDQKCQQTFQNRVKPFCDTAKRKCFQCFNVQTQHKHCPDKQVCNANNECEVVQCEKDPHCTDDGFLSCDKKTNKCKQCASHQECDTKTESYTTCNGGVCGMWMKCVGYTWRNVQGEIEPAMKIRRKNSKDEYEDIAHFHINIAEITFRSRNCPFDQKRHSQINDKVEFRKVISDCRRNTNHAWSLGDGNFFSKPEKETSEFWTPLTKDHKIPKCFFGKHTPRPAKINK